MQCVHLVSSPRKRRYSNEGGPCGGRVRSESLVVPGCFGIAAALGSGSLVHMFLRLPGGILV